MQTVCGALLDFVAAQQRRHDANCCPKERKEKGHFGTPPEIAAFMAAMFPKLPSGTIRILDPGAGVGTLTAALCDRIARLKQPRRVSVEAWENDSALLPYLAQTMTECRDVLESCGHQFWFTIQTDDFVLANADRPLFGKPRSDRFNVVITNPPYFKLRKETEHARLMPHVVHGQPNIYALFLAVSADLLRDNGYLVAITPRSYFNGPYFHRFRRWFFDRIAPRHVHLFESRKAAFRDDAVLQENVILGAEKSADHSDVTVTVSDGRDLSPTALQRRTLSFSQVIDDPKGDCIVRVSGNDFDQQIVDAIDRLPKRFRDSGLEISTGPVVHFRATGLLLHEKLDADRSAPLLWMHNVRPFVTNFAATHNGKATHIKVCEKSRSILLRARRYVLLKRFTAKEEKRRLVAGIIEPDECDSPFVGLDNKLNYVHKPKGELTVNEAFGLAALLNSAVLDRYFRAISGNTQVNAAEIRMLPMPDLRTVAKVGEKICRMSERDPTAVEEIVGEVIGLDRSIIRQLSGLE
jgi:adenine-specific DNA-methyltransferase